MTGDTLCRWAQPLGGRHDDGCDEPQRPGGRFCERHAAVLARVAANIAASSAKAPGERPIHVGMEPAPVITRHVEPRPARKPSKSRAPYIAPELLADQIVAYVNAAETLPVQRATLCERFDRSARTIARAVTLAVADGRVKAQTYGPPGARGYYRPGTEPTDTTNLEAAA